jgi:uncharacterized membrane protein
MYAVGVFGILIVSLPPIAGLISLPSGEQFTELYLLGSQHMAEDYPYNISPNQDYTVHLGVTNHVGSSAYYMVYVKLLNSTDTLPDTLNGTASPTKPIYDYRFSIQDGQTYETRVRFAFTDTNIIGNQAIVGSLQINNENIKVDKSTTWNATTQQYPYRLIFELWQYNSQSNTLAFNNRYVSLKLNLTRTP